MLRCPANLNRLTARLRMLAITWGPWPLRTCERSSSLSRYRDNDDYAEQVIMPS